MWKLINKKTTYQPPEFKQFIRLRIVTFSVIRLIGLSTLLGIFFIYNNIYITISTAEEIISERNGLPSLEIIDFTKFEKVMSIWQTKNNPSEMIINRDPFSLPPPTPTTTIEKI